MTTKELAKFTSNLTYEKLSNHSIDMAKKCILDHLGVAIRGSQEKPAKLIRSVVLKSNSEEATVFDKNTKKATALEAAFCNGAASHTLDFDDLHNPSIIHLACVVVPPALALAEANHKTGKELITAVCSGYEAGGRTGESVIPESYFFWHTTGTAGTIGAAAAAANILGLDEHQTIMCYGSAGTQTAGLWEFLKEGAMSKALHAGKGAFAGVLSAQLAQAGFTGASKILEGEKGFCHAMVREPHLEKLTEGLGEELKIDKNSFKPYACCKHSHAAIYAIQVLRKEYNLQPEDIAGIKIYVNDITNYLINNPNPQNPYGCKFSIQYCTSAMLKYGVVGVEQFNADVINDGIVHQLMAKTEVILDDEIEKIHQDNPAKLASKVELVCKDGRCLSMQVDFPKGDPDNPFTWEEAKEKFMNLVIPVYGVDKAEKIYTFVRTLEVCEDVAEGIKNCLEE